MQNFMYEPVTVYFTKVYEFLHEKKKVKIPIVGLICKANGVYFET